MMRRNVSTVLIVSTSGVRLETIANITINNTKTRRLAAANADLGKLFFRSDNENNKNRLPFRVVTYLYSVYDAANVTNAFRTKFNEHWEKTLKMYSIRIGARETNQKSLEHRSSESVFVPKSQNRLGFGHVLLY